MEQVSSIPRSPEAMMKARRSNKRAILASLKWGEGWPRCPFILSKIVAHAVDVWYGMVWYTLFKSLKQVVIAPLSLCCCVVVALLLRCFCVVASFRCCRALVALLPSCCCCRAVSTLLLRCGCTVVALLSRCCRYCCFVVVDVAPLLRCCPAVIAVLSRCFC